MEPTFNEVYRKLKILAIKYKNPYYTVEELINVGYIGYRKALASHNNEKGSLMNYADIRIRGEILDYMRNNTIGKRSPKAFVSIDEINDNILTETKDRALPPFTQEVQDALSCHFCSDVMALRNMAIAMLILEDRELTVLKEYYWNGNNMRDIAEKCGTSEAYISLTKKSAIQKLRAYLN